MAAGERGQWAVKLARGEEEFHVVGAEGEEAEGLAERAAPLVGSNARAETVGNGWPWRSKPPNTSMNKGVNESANASGYDPH
jgi:hypothetical protein